MGLIGMDVINIKNEEVGTVVGDLNGKYIINVDGEEKFYSESTLIKNWKIVEEETEEISEAVLTTEETEEEVINENDEVIEEETENVIDEENTEDENKNDEVIEEETEEFILETENEAANVIRYTIERLAFGILNAYNNKKLTSIWNSDEEDSPVKKVSKAITSISSTIGSYKSTATDSLSIFRT